MRTRINRKKVINSAFNFIFYVACQASKLNFFSFCNLSISRQKHMFVLHLKKQKKKSTQNLIQKNSDPELQRKKF